VGVAGWNASAAGHRGLHAYPVFVGWVLWVGSYTLLGPEKTPVGVRAPGGVCLWSAPGLSGLTHLSLCMVVRVVGGCGGWGVGLGCGCVLSVA
jgi:hypothetical protein